MRLPTWYRISLIEGSRRGIGDEKAVSDGML
jgi:hypothetical protein